MKLHDFSVIVTEYSYTNKSFLIDCINSIRSQNYSGDIELIILLENNKLYKEINDKYSEKNNIIIEYLNKTSGVADARTKGIKYASNEIIAYIDSDAIADKNWISTLNKGYNNKNILAVGGKAIPLWEQNKPKWFPDEFLWLVGCTHKYHPQNNTVIRNNFGCNMSFKKEILIELNGFDNSVGKSHGYNLQGEEPELGQRMLQKYNTGSLYLEDAIIYHHVSQTQKSKKWLYKRAYLQGITKAVIQKNDSQQTKLETENDYLKNILFSSIPLQFKKSLQTKQTTEFVKLIHLFLFTSLVIIGYVIGKIKL